MTVRAALPTDAHFILDLASEAFRAYGDYRSSVTEWLQEERVSTFVAELEQRPAGFAMVGFFRPDETAALYAAYLLIVAVATPMRGRGAGRALLEHALVVARAARKKIPVREMRLTVADDNSRARHLFCAAGFVDDGASGHYDGGQRALQMVRTL